MGACSGDAWARGEVPAKRGPAQAELQQAGFTAHLLKILNPGGSTGRLRTSSPQAGPVYAGVAELSMKRQDQPQLNENANVRGDANRFLHSELFTGVPMKALLSGLEAEYAILLLYSSVSGKRAAVLQFDVASERQNSSAPNEVLIPFDIRPAVKVKLSITDFDGRPTAARLTFRDAAGHVFPSQPKRLAPDFFFQEQIYRQHGASSSNKTPRKTASSRGMKRQRRSSLRDFRPSTAIVMGI